MKGFLGTWASFSADLNLLIQIAMRFGHCSAVPSQLG